jgi:hypothetical protein
MARKEWVMGITSVALSGFVALSLSPEGLENLFNQ